MRRLLGLAAIALTLAACGGSNAGTHVAADAPSTTASTHRHATTSSTSEATTTTQPQPPDTSAGSPHFDTPEDAMRYLAAAWNADDLVSLKHVTNPSARAELDAMHEEATNLRLDRCELNEGVGDYTCYFDHDYPATHTSVEGEAGQAIFLAGPADKPGWYMTVFESCG